MKKYESIQALANGLAHALLSGPADSASAHARCAHAMGRDHPWLGNLVGGLVSRFGATWEAVDHERVAERVLTYLRSAGIHTLPRTPRVRHHVLTYPRMGVAPSWRTGLDLPRMPTSGDIAEWLDISVDDLDWFTLNRRRRSPRSDHYVYRWLPKRRGGHRLIESPKRRLRSLQRGLLDRLITSITPHEAAHGFRTGHSALSNASVHVGQPIVIRLDLKDFFLNVGAARVAAMFRTLGYPAGSAATLSALCTNVVPHGALVSGTPSGRDADKPRPDWRERQRFQTPHLPQGAPTSPALANLCAFRLDCRLSHAAATVGARYTRYADDLVFSGGTELDRAARRFPSWVGGVALEEGFCLNYRKTRIMRGSTRQQVTGIVVNQKPNLARPQYDNLKATLHNCVRFGAASQNRDRRQDFRAHLAGRIAHLHQLNPRRAGTLRTVFEKIQWD